MKLLDIKGTDEDETIIITIIDSLKKELSNLGITINNGEKSISDWSDEKTIDLRKSIQGGIRDSLSPGLKEKIKKIIEKTQAVEKESSEPPLYKFTIKAPDGGVDPPAWYNVWYIVKSKLAVSGGDVETIFNEELTFYDFLAFLEMTPEEFLLVLRTLEKFLFEEVDSFNQYMNGSYKEQITKLKDFYGILDNLHNYFLPDTQSIQYKKLDDKKGSFNVDLGELKTFTVGDFEILTKENEDFDKTFFSRPGENPLPAEDIFMNVSQLNTMIPHKPFEVKIGIAFKRSGESLDKTKKKYLRHKLKPGFSSPFPTNEQLNTFKITENGEFLLSVKDQDPEFFNLSDPNEILKLRKALKDPLTQHISFLKDKLNDQEQKQVYMFLWEDNQIKKKESNVPKIEEEPQMSFWFES